MINKKSSGTAICMLIACSFLIIAPANAQTRIQATNSTSTPTPIKAPARVSGTVINPSDPHDKGVIIFLSAILENEARLGRNPGNSQLLAEIQQLVQGKSIQAKSVVKVTNNGPGQLKTISSDGSGWMLQSGQSIELDVDSNKIFLKPENNNVLVELRHVRNAPFRFWDEDDQRHYPIGPGSSHQATLAPGVHGYHLEQ